MSMLNMDQDRLKLDLEYVTQVRPLPQEETLKDVLIRLDAVAKESGLPQKLVHYLTKRSYMKALAWFDYPDSPHHP